MGYKALDVADYIVDYCNKKGQKITHLQLQKILYFAEANYLVMGSSLFDDEISKWRLGPVVQSVYHEYKIFGSNNINYIPNRLEFDPSGKINFISYNPNAIDEKDKEKLSKIIDKYIIFPPFTLVDATHQHEPWKKDKEKIDSGVQGLIYDKEELRKFFKENPVAFEVNIN